MALSLLGQLGKLSRGIVQPARIVSCFLFFSFSLSACGLVGICKNDCGPGWVHGSFDCGCMQISKGVPTQPNNQPSSAYYITRQYYCVEQSNSNQDRGDCLVTRAASSCSEALSSIDAYYASVRDPCKRCDPNILDNTRQYNGHFDDIQAGPCQGFSLNYTPSRPIKEVRPETAAIENASFTTLFPARLNHYMRLIATDPQDNSPQTCNSECLSGSPFCLNVNLDQQNSIGFERLHRSFLQHPDTISAADLRGMFGDQRDDCLRGPTTLSGGAVYNSGNGLCELAANIPDAGSVALRVPEMIRGTWKIQNTLVSVLFGNPRTRGRLKFSDPGLDQDWGGDIVAVYGDSDYVGFSIGTLSCVRASFSPH
jgi:hypothetical protein